MKIYYISWIVVIILLECVFSNRSDRSEVSKIVKSKNSNKSYKMKVKAVNGDRHQGCFSFSRYLRVKVCYTLQCNKNGVRFTIHRNGRNLKSYRITRKVNELNSEQCRHIPLKTREGETCFKWADVSWPKENFKGCLYARAKMDNRKVPSMDVNCLVLSCEKLRTSKKKPYEGIEVWTRKPNRYTTPKNVPNEEFPPWEVQPEENPPMPHYPGRFPEGLKPATIIVSNNNYEVQPSDEDTSPRADQFPPYPPEPSPPTYPPNLPPLPHTPVAQPSNPNENDPDPSIKENLLPLTTPTPSFPSPQNPRLPTQQPESLAKPIEPDSSQSKRPAACDVPPKGITDDFYANSNTEDLCGEYEYYEDDTLQPIPGTAGNKSSSLSLNNEMVVPVIVEDSNGRPPVVNLPPL